MKKINKKRVNLTILRSRSSKDPTAAKSEENGEELHRRCGRNRESEPSTSWFLKLGIANGLCGTFRLLNKESNE